MSSSSDQNPNFTLNEKLTPSTFPQWRAQFEALLIGYDLLDYVEGTLLCPFSSGTATDELCKLYWVWQDKLILSAILASTSSSITPLIATTKTSHEAWKKLKNLHASQSRTRAMQLKEELTLIHRGHRSITEYLHAVKTLVDEIAIIDHSISDDDLTLYVLNGLGSEFQEIMAPIRARESPMTFEELHDLLVGHEAYLRRLETTMQHLVASTNYTKTKSSNSNYKGNQQWSPKPNDNPREYQGSSTGINFNGTQRDGRRFNSIRANNFNRRYRPKCQICDQFGHVAKSCPQFHPQNVFVNCATTSTGKNNNWLLDSAASHNITGDLSNLSIHSEYDGTAEVILGDGLGLAVSHTGSLNLQCTHRNFTLHDTLYVPNLRKNLISVHHFTKQNHVFVELHPFHFFMKDATTTTILLKGACNNGIYIFPDSMVTPQKVANVHERTSIDGWCRYTTSGDDSSFFFI